MIAVPPKESPSNENKMITIVYLAAAKLSLPKLTNPTPACMFSP